MPYSRPSLTELNATALQDIQSANISGVDGLLQKAVLRVLTRAISGLAYEHYGYQDWIAEQAVPWTSTEEFLEGWAALKGVTRKPATTAALVATFTGTNGTPIPIGTTLSTENSLSFVTTAAATIAAGSAMVPIAASGTGTAYNLAIGTSIVLSNVIPGVNSSGAVASIITSASDIETDDALRTRTLQVYASPPQGGAATDYVEWAEAVPSVSRAWCNPNGAGAGTVVVYVMLDYAESAHGGFPQGSNGVAAVEPRAVAATGDQLTVANAIYPLQPVTALVEVVAPAAAPVNFLIASVYPYSATIVAGISAALSDLFVRIGSPLGMTVYPSDWETAIASVAGMGHFNVTSPAGPVTIPLGQLPTLGTVSATA